MQSIGSFSFLLPLFDLGFSPFSQDSMLFSQPLGELDLRLFELLSLFGGVVVKGSQGQQCSLGWFIVFGFLFIVVGENWTVLFIDEIIIALFGLTRLNGLFYPSLKFKFLGIIATIQSELKYFLTLPELLRTQPKYFPSLYWQFLLIVIVIPLYVWGIGGGVTIFVKQKFAEIIIFKGELKTDRFIVVQRGVSHSQGMDDPFGLEIQFSSNG